MAIYSSKKSDLLLNRTGNTWCLAALQDETSASAIMEVAATQWLERRKKQK
jgi:hypothetical protein